MRNLLAFWRSLPPGRKTALGIVGSWAGAWLIGRVLDGMARLMPGLTGISRLILDYALNGYVIAFLFGALFVGFGPTIWSGLRKLIHQHGCAGLAVGSLILVMFGFLFFKIGINVYSIIFDSPRSFTPGAPALVDENGNKRDFSAKTVGQINNIFARNTDLQAREIVKPQIGKWIAISGAVRDIEPSELQNNIDVVLGTRLEAFADLYFDKSYSSKLAKMKKWGHIYAICKFMDAHEYSIKLTDCELTSHK